MLLAYKYRIYPTVEQEVFLAKHFGCARFVYNWGLAIKNAAYQKDKGKISCFDLVKIVTQLKKQEGTNWLNEVNAQSLQMPLRNLDIAFTKFFKNQTRFPKFKSKHDAQTFQCPQFVKVDFEKGNLHLPKFKTPIKAVFHRTFEGDIKTCTVSKTKSGKYFISILTDNHLEAPKKPQISEKNAVGIDLGIKHFAILSTGEKVENPRWTEEEDRRLKRRQRAVDKSVKGSKNRAKKKLRLARLHEKIVNQRKDFHHKLSTKLICENQTICLEDLGVKEMMENKLSHSSLHREISNVGWAQFVNFLEYKGNLYGKNVIKIGRFEPSSKTCKCGYINDLLELSDREWRCIKCGAVHDRDVLAAQNIKTFALNNLINQEIDQSKKVGQELPELVAVKPVTKSLRRCNGVSMK